MNRQILFFDIDGTLVDSTTHIVPASTRAALQKLKKAGHILCISTGRSLQSVTDAHFDELIDWDIFLCNNGQAIYKYDKILRGLHSGCGNAGGSAADYGKEADSYPQAECIRDYLCRIL